MFNLIVLILVTIVFLMFGYLITHVDIFSPFCVFCEMFLIAEFLCLFFSRMYKVEIHLNTILVIALGMISFGIVSAFFYMKTVASIGFVKHLLVTFILYKVLIDKGVALEYRHGIKLKFKRQKKTVIPMGTN